jgi:nucleoside-diphosphate-sugar epimerase
MAESIHALREAQKPNPFAPSPAMEELFACLDQGALEALAAGTEAVIHCAGTVRGARRSDFDRVNAEGAGRVARAAAVLPRPPRFLLMSSLAARMPDDYAGSKWRNECAVKSARDLR